MSKEYHRATFTEVPPAEEDSQMDAEVPSGMDDVKNTVAVVGVLSSVLLAVFLPTSPVSNNLTLVTGAAAVAAPAATSYLLYAAYSVVALVNDL